MSTHRWYQTDRPGPAQAVDCNCPAGGDHVYSPECMWDDNPAVSISAGDYGQPVGPKCTRHTNPAKLPAGQASREDGHAPGSRAAVFVDHVEALETNPTPNGVICGFDDREFPTMAALTEHFAESHKGQVEMTPDAAPKRPLHTRISSTYYGETRSRVHARFEAATDAEDLMCGATGLPTDDVETTTDAVDCPLCLRLLESRETYTTMLAPDIAPDRPLNLRVASMTGAWVHAPSVKFSLITEAADPKGDAEPLRDGLCAVRARPTDFVELTTDPVDCPACLALELAEYA